ncbi:uncharacterized protein LOC123898680 [Trifolium pratense]|uniref:uncharacterized protein LOC123898680 n=1 Tax=Trifolium pratense TaxID=57577 RepID=UPI001E6934F3|nr:uncharacterized protein LOC123898680 [Trifolium pratense]
MENKNNKKKVGGAGSSSSSTTNFDHLFGPKDPSNNIFNSIFPPPSTGGRRDSTRHDMGSNNTYGAPGKKGESSTVSDTNYQINETVEPSYYSSSIYYGGQENYTNSPRTCRTTQPPHFIKKDKDDDDDDSNGSDTGGASRGNWWKGSLYY